MQKPLADLLALLQAELVRLVEREPLLVTKDGEPQFVAQSLDSFDEMVRRLRQLEAKARATVSTSRGKLILLRP